MRAGHTLLSRRSPSFAKIAASFFIDGRFVHIEALVDCDALVQEAGFWNNSNVSEESSAASASSSTSSRATRRLPLAAARTSAPVARRSKAVLRPRDHQEEDRLQHQCLQLDEDRHGSPHLVLHDRLPRDPQVDGGRGPRVDRPCGADVPLGERHGRRHVKGHPVIEPQPGALPRWTPSRP